MLCSYFMGLNLSNQQIAAELNLSVTQAQEMTTQLRQGLLANSRWFWKARWNVMKCLLWRATKATRTP